MEEYLRLGQELAHKYDNVRLGRINRIQTITDNYSHLLKPFLPSAEKQDMVVEKKELGDIAYRYLNMLDQNKSCMHIKENQLYVGTVPITVSDNNIYLNDNTVCQGTEGLWRALTTGNKKGMSKKEKDDLTLIQNRSLFTKDWVSQNTRNKVNIKKEQTYSGDGLQKYISKTPSSVEYVYWNTVDELKTRLNILLGEIQAGNTNPTIRNEITNIVEELTEERKRRRR